MQEKSKVTLQSHLVTNSKTQQIKKLVSMSTAYNKIKYKDEVYSLGDNILIRDTNDGFLIGKLVKIIQANAFKKYPYWPAIQIQW